MYKIYIAKFIYFGIILLSIIDNISCTKDKGNYSYLTVDTLQFKNIDSVVNVMLGSNPQIFPSFASSLGTLDTAEDNFTYEWLVYDKTAASTLNQRIILDTTKNLDENLNLGVGSYPAYYKVTQKSTGISWTKSFKLIVSGAFGKYGWFVLSEVADSSELDYFQDSSDNWNTFPINYKNINKLITDASGSGDYLSIPGKPLSLASYTNRDYVNTANKLYLYINTDHITQKLNITDGFVWDKSKYLFRYETVTATPPRADGIIPYSLNESIAFYDNNIYTYFYTGSTYYSIPVNKLSSGSTFPVSKYMASTYSSNFYTILFDTVGKRFVRFAGYSSKSCTQMDYPTAAFNPDQIKKNLIWLGYTVSFGGQAVAILKDTAASNYYLARISFSSTGTIVPLSLTDITNRLTDISTATHFAIDQQYGYLFYTAQGKLYEYDMDNDILNVAMDLGNKSVSMLKTNRDIVYNPTASAFTKNPTRFNAVGYSIILGLYDSNNPDNSGEVHFLKPGALMSAVTEYFSPFKGMGKVVDVNYLPD